MTESNKQNLEQQLWNIANELRGKMGADEFRDYILGFIFYKYLSEKLRHFADRILTQDGIKYKGIDESNAQGTEYLEAIKEETLEKLGYFLKPSELFSTITAKGNADTGDETFILEDLTSILNSIEQSTMGTDSEEEFGNLFEELDLTSTKLGKSEKQKNDLVCKILYHLDKVDFETDNAESDVLGDYLYSNQTIQRDDVIQSLNEKPKLLERKPVAQRVIDRIYTFVDTYIYGMAS